MIVKYTVKPTSRFRKDYKLMEKRNLDMSLLDSAIALLAKGEPLPAAYRDHALVGDWKVYRECHVTPDWLLVYSKDEESGELLLILTRLANHNTLRF